MSDKKEKQPIILSLHNRGNIEFPRYMISDQYLRYWTGKDWTQQKDEDGALVYANANSALEDMHQLMMIQHQGQAVYRFHAPLYVELFTNNQVTKKQLQQWLVKVTKLIMDTTEYGNGPIAGSYGTCRIEYGELKEQK